MTIAPQTPGAESLLGGEPPTPSAAAPVPALESPPPSSAGALPEGEAAGPATSITPSGPEITQEQLAAATAALDELLSASTSALEGLESYRYSTVYSFTGEVNGESESGSIELHGAVSGSDRQMLEWKDLESGDEFGIVRVGADAWMREGGHWSQVPPMVADVMTKAVLVFDPSVTWGGLAQGMEGTSTLVGTEAVNGILTRHYTSTTEEWAKNWEGQIEDAQGDVWIAEAGYPVRYRFTATGIDSEGYKGSMLWTMELADVNASISIEPPPVTEGDGD